MITFQDVKKSYGSYIFDVSSLHIPQGIITGWKKWSRKNYSN